MFAHFLLNRFTMTSANMNQISAHSSSRKKYMRRVREMSLTKQMSWIKNMASNGYIGMCLDGSANSTNDVLWKTEWLDKYLEQMGWIIDALEVAHPGNWDMHIQEHENRYIGVEGQRNYLFTLHPIIRYPDLTIKNSRDESAQIEELIVYIPLSLNTDFLDFDIAIGEIKGTRYKFCYDHYTSGYIHSHLNSQSKPAGRIKTFCIGEDDLYDMQLEMSANGFSEGMFGLWLATLDNMVAWESIEGVPFSYIREIVSASEDTQINPSRSDIASFYAGRFRPWLRNEQRFEANFVYNKGRYQIKKDEVFNKFMRDYVINAHDGQFINTWLCKEKDGKFYAPKQGVQGDIPELLQELADYNGFSEPPYTIICGQKIKTHIRQTVFAEEEDINNFNVHPKFLDYVAIQLERELYEKAVTSSAVGREAETSDA